MSGRTLYEKIWDSHVVDSPLQEAARKEALGQTDSPTDSLTGERQALLYVDLHLIHEVTSPQAFEGLRQAGRAVRRPDLTLGTVDHNVPTIGRDLPNPDPLSARQIEVMQENAREFGVDLYDIYDSRQGIVHIIGPRTRIHPAWNDHRLRGQPHLNAWCVWRAGLWYRHLRGGTRLRHTDPSADTVKDDVD